MKYLSICSGIEAATVAFHPLGWSPVAFAEIEPFPCAVLKHHYPAIPNLGDITKYREWPEEVLAECDLLVGGPPCQAFSIAGRRESLADERGNLTLTYVNIINHIDSIRRKHGRDPIIALYENVPGIYSTRDNAFGCLVGALCGQDGPVETETGKWPTAGVLWGAKRRVGYRTLDAQFFGLAQRRRRCFLLAMPNELVERLGDRADPGEILSLPESLRGDSPPSRETGESSAVCPPLRAGGNRTGGDRSPGTDVDTAESLIAFPATMSGTQRASSWDVSPSLGASNPTAVARCRRGGSNQQDGTANAILTPNGGRAGVGAVAYRVHGEHSTAMTGNGVANVADPVDVARCLDTCGGYSTNQGGNVVAQAFHQNTRDELRYVGGDGGIAGALAAEPGMKQQNFIQQAMAVRRLTVRECEQLQGFPEVMKHVTFRVWSTGHQRIAAVAATSSLKSQRSASNAGGSESPRPVLHVASHSPIGHPNLEKPVAAHVLIDSERQHLQLHSLGRLLWSANSAGKAGSFPLPTPPDVFVPAVAAMTTALVNGTRHGKAGLLLPVRLSSHPLNGSVVVHLSGPEIAAYASDAASHMSAGLPHYEGVADKPVATMRGATAALPFSQPIVGQ